MLDWRQTQQFFKCRKGKKKTEILSRYRLIVMDHVTKFQWHSPRQEDRKLWAENISS